MREGPFIVQGGLERVKCPRWAEDNGNATGCGCVSAYVGASVWARAL